MQISSPNCSLSSQSFLSNLSLLSKVFSMIMFKVKWDLKPLSLNKNLKKFRLLRDLRLQASSNNGKRPCSNINITSNMKCYLNHVCRSKIKSGSCAACPRCPKEPFKTSHVANMWLRCTVRWKYRLFSLGGKGSNPVEEWIHSGFNWTSTLFITTNIWLTGG